MTSAMEQTTATVTTTAQTLGQETSLEFSQTIGQSLQTELFSDLPKIPKANKVAELELADVRVKVSTDATPSALRQIREIVENKYSQFATKKTVKGITPHQQLLLTAYSLAEELLKEREKSKVLKRKVNERLGRLLDRVESNLK